MKKTKHQMMELLNDRLEQYNQNIRIIDHTANSITLSSGVTLADNAKHRFCKRIMNSKTDLWISNIDRLSVGEITEKEIRSVLCAIGGKAVNQKYGDIIRKNLNTGVSWNAGTKGQNIGSLGPRKQEVKDKISAKNSGENNGMYGVKMSPASKQLRSTKMKELILSGKFTPNSNNRNTHWDATFDNKKYRSSWEALYQYINPMAEYETLRIQYELDNTTKIYIVDFVDHTNKIVAEIKPSALCVGDEFNAKVEALTEWASKHSYDTLIVDEQWLCSHKEHIDYTKFDQNTGRKIQNLYEITKKNRDR